MKKKFLMVSFSTREVRMITTEFNSNLHIKLVGEGFLTVGELHGQNVSLEVNEFHKYIKPLKFKK